MRRNKFD